MAELDPSERSEVAIRSSTLTVLEAVAIVRKQPTHEVLDDLVEQARAKLSPEPKQPSTGGRGGRPKAQP